MTTESSSNRIDVRSENLEPPSWMGGFPSYVHAVLGELSVTNWEVSFLLTDDDTMAALNLQFRDKEGPTDVLSFAAFDGIDAPSPQETGEPVPAGDIVIDVPLVVRQAAEWGVDAEEELRRVTVHGILHLAGHDHRTNDFQEEPMLRLQERILETVKERIY
tara:strand:- start:2 stop:484 length:483 start_codon:yes stop_codon:yes gene_type:complete